MKTVSCNGDSRLIDKTLTTLGRRQLEAVARLYRARPCLVCGRQAICPHREPVVDLAELSTAVPGQGGVSAKEPLATPGAPVAPWPVVPHYPPRRTVYEHDWRRRRAAYLERCGRVGC